MGMKKDIHDYVFQNYGLFNELGYEESDKRGYLTFTCYSGAYIAVMAKYSTEVTVYKFEKRGAIYND